MAKGLSPNKNPLFSYGQANTKIEEKIINIESDSFKENEPENINNPIQIESHPLSQELISRALSRDLSVSEIHFNYTGSPHKISFFETLDIKSGWLAIDKLTNIAFEIQEHILFTAIADDGTIFDEELSQKLIELPALNMLPITNTCITEDLEIVREKNKQEKLYQIQQTDFQYYKEECDKLDSWTDDLKDGLEREIKQMEREISEIKKTFGTAKTMEELAGMQKQKNDLEKKRKEKMQRN